MFTGVIWLLAGPAYAVDCPAPPSVIVAASVKVESAWTAFDKPGVTAGAIEAREALACADAPLRPSEVAAFFRSLGLAAFLNGDKNGAINDFAAARAANPTYELPSALAGPTHPLRSAWDDAKSVPADTMPLPAPRVGTLQVDGVRALAAPTARPWVFQHLDASGVVIKTVYVEVGAPMPTWEVAPAVVVEAPADPVAPDEARAASLAVVGGMTVYTRNPAGRVFGTVSPVLGIPVGPVDLDVAAVLGLGPLADGASVLPMLRVGVVSPGKARFGAALTVSSHADAVLVAGVSALAGLRLGPVAIDASGGWNGGPTGGVAAGVAFDL